MLLLSVLSIPLFFLLAACGNVAPSQSQAEWIAPAEAYTPSWFTRAKKQSFRSHGQYIAAQAIAVAKGLYGTQTNEYYADDPSMAAVIAYWKRSCQNGDGSLCADAQSGNLQCVEFVSGVFALIDDDLPYGGDANQFWRLYQGKTGWQEISANAVLRNAPELGDMMAWTGNSVGHLSIVIDRQLPTRSNDGYILVAHANATHAFERLTWHTDGRIDSWPGYQLQGFIRQQEIAPCLQQQITTAQQQWETLAIEAAVHYGIPSKYFLRQLCQSGFQPETTLASGTGATGIAQLPASVAARIPRCVIDFIANPVDCGQRPGSLPAGIGINPAQPAEALPAAAYEMATLYTRYLRSQGMQIPQDEVEAYRMALAAYHSGNDIVDKTVSACGKMRWLTCLDEEQKNHSASDYVSLVLTNAK